KEMGTSYSHFLSQHIEFPKSSASSDQNYCKLMMQHRDLTHPFCITSNTFIQAPTNQVQGVCSSGGKWVCDNIYNSIMCCTQNIARFDITECQLTSSFLGRCKYRTTVLRSGIRSVCLGGWG
uniref:Ribonuclease A-domain domain-containing protein n=1 Tax=Chelydra serpentina TaxID=8475 RepID=A0A8C3S9K0_CHESE